MVTKAGSGPTFVFSSPPGRLRVALKYSSLSEGMFRYVGIDGQVIFVIPSEIVQVKVPPS